MLEILLEPVSVGWNEVSAWRGFAVDGAAVLRTTWGSNGKKGLSSQGWGHVACVTCS